MYMCAYVCVYDVTGLLVSSDDTINILSNIDERFFNTTTTTRIDERRNGQGKIDSV